MGILVGRDSQIRIARLVELEAAGWDRVLLKSGIDAIFRATAARWPDDPAAAQAFQQLWLDQYFDHERELLFVAHRADAAREAPSVVGYLAGCTVNPSTSPRFAKLDYFRAFAAQCAAYPAHLHVNVDAEFRGAGLGAALVEALSDRLTADGISGVHVVTGRTQRNVRFYQRLGFRAQAAAPRGTGDVVFLGRKL